MANMKGTTNLRNTSCSGKQSFLPPKSPIPSISPAFAEYNSSACIGSKAIPKTKEGLRHHQRTSSESFLIDEQPSWLDDLLNEPETPVKRGGHRRSSSDSFAYLDASNIARNIDNLVQEEYTCVSSVPSWRSQDVQYASYHAEASHFVGPLNRGWESASNTASYPASLPLAVDKFIRQSPGSSGALRESDSIASQVTEKREQEDSASQYLKVSSESKEGYHAKHSQSEMDPKRVKQQFAQRSRVRKLQYIAELERNVQALQAEGSEVSAELEFLDQQNLILSLENKALKQRLDSVAQEQLIKHLQQEMLEKEIARLQALYQQQQQPQPVPKHGRSRSRDLDAQFANLSLKHKEANSARDPVTGPLRI